MNDTILEQVSYIKFLGVIINDKITLHGKRAVS